MNFEKVKAWLEVAQDEIETLREYTDKLDIVEEVDKLKEIMGDEVNHALIALMTAALELDLNIPEDGLSELMEEAFGGLDDEY